MWLILFVKAFGYLAQLMSSQMSCDHVWPVCLVYDQTGSFGTLASQLLTTRVFELPQLLATRVFQLRTCDYAPLRYVAVHQQNLLWKCELPFSQRG